MLAPVRLRVPARLVLPLAVLAMALTACSDAAPAYRTCPPGVDPGAYDCIPTTIGDDTGDDTDLPDVGQPDTDVPDISIPDVGPTDTRPQPDVCIPDCSGRECGNDGCGGICGVCDGGFACSAGTCVPRGGGDLTCGGIIECVQVCGGGEDCLWECMDQGTPDAQELFMMAVDCVETNCGGIEDDREMARCQQRFCGDVLQECIGGGFGGTGDMVCEEVFFCMLECGNSDACVQECYYAGTATAQQQIQSLTECVGGRCDGVATGDEWIECSFDACPRFASACFENEIEPLPGETCSDIERRRLEDFGDEVSFFLLECGWSCLEATGEWNVECAAECTGGPLGLGWECSLCTGELSLCTVEACGPECDDPLADDCQECIEDVCMDRFEVCSGL